MSTSEKSNLIADIKRLMNPPALRQSGYESFTANKVVDKLLVRLGIVAIIALVGYLVIKDSVRNKSCKC